MEVKTVVWWEAQNTGWSDGTSWFNSAGAGVRFNTMGEALAFNKTRMVRLGATTKWRVVKITHTLQAFKQED